MNDLAAMATETETQPRQLPVRSKSCCSPDLRSRMTDALDCLPTSPDGVITYMGRSYEVKDLFPSLDDEGSSSSNRDEIPAPADLQKDGKKSAVSHIDRRRRPARRTVSAAEGGNKSLSPIRRCRSNSFSTVKRPAGLTGGPPPTRVLLPVPGVQAPNMAAAACSIPPPPSHGRLTRARSLGEAASSVCNLLVGGLSLEEEEEYGIHSTSMRHLQYNQDDVNGIIDDQKEFARLKATLKKKGAVTNEVLKQRLHYYVKAKKDRDAGLVFPPPLKRKSKRMQRSRSEAQKEEVVTEQFTTPVLTRRGAAGRTA